MEKIGGLITENFVTIALFGIMGCVALYHFSMRKNRQQQKREAMFDEVNSSKYDDDQIQ